MNIFTFTLIAAVAVATAVRADPWDGTAITNQFINLGGTDVDHQSVDCAAYAGMFLVDGELHSPGVPDAVGTQAILAACKASSAAVSPLLSFQSHNIAVTSWDESRRVATAWTINGLRTADHVGVSAPAISALFMDRDFKIENAWSFYDERLIDGDVVPPPFNGSTIAWKYVTNGAGVSGKQSNCAAWASLFAPNGTSNEPGIPPSGGADRLTAACQNRASKFQLLVPSIQTLMPVMSWDTTKRLGFSYTISGVAADGQSTYEIPAITILFMTADQKITEALDFWDTDRLPGMKAFGAAL